MLEITGEDQHIGVIKLPEHDLGVEFLIARQALIGAGQIRTTEDDGMRGPALKMAARQAADILLNGTLQLTPDIGKGFITLDEGVQPFQTRFVKISKSAINDKRSVSIKPVIRRCLRDNRPQRQADKEQECCDHSRHTVKFLLTLTH